MAPGLLSAQPRPPSDVPVVFNTLEGSWEGEGVLLGRPGAFEMTWSVDEAGFVHLAFSNALVLDGGSTTPVLSARATYLPDGPAATGVWVDTRPQRLTLEATLTDSTVVTTWVAETETGRTEYVVRSPDLVEVRDYVLQGGEYSLFAEASYSRAR